MAKEKTTGNTPNTTPWRFGGLLYLAGLSVILAPALEIFDLFIFYHQPPPNPAITQLFDPGSHLDSAALRWIFYLDAFTSLIFFLFSFFVIRLFFMKKQEFRATFLMQLWGTALSHFITWNLLHIAFPAAYVLYPEADLTLTLSLCFAIFWTTYVIDSERVAHTFVK